MIFILEDDIERINAFHDALEGLPHRIMRTVPEAKEWLKTEGDAVSLYSLDNDLLVPEYSGEPGEGWQLCLWITSRMRKAPVIIHTSNSIAATKMYYHCIEAGWTCNRVIPVDGINWIRLIWLRELKKFLGHQI